MRIRTRIFLAFFAAGALGLWYSVDWALDEVRPPYLKSMEESLVDTANILASIASERVEGGRVEAAEFRRAFEDAYRKELEAKIYDLVKTRVDLRVYITDAKGVVVFDSDGGKAEGEDYSQWNDVYLTLRGEYGARSTRSDPKDPSTSVLHVAAPVRARGELVGVLTVCKPVGTVHLFIAEARRRILLYALAAGAALFLLCYLISLWLTVPIRRLTAFAQAVRDGRRARLPRLARSEIRTMALAFDQMREALEGRRYVEQYVQTLTHEIKGPLSAVRGAAELLAEDMPPERRARFAASIRTEAERIGRLVDRLLELAALESRRGLGEVEEVDLASLLAGVAESAAPLLEAKGLALRTDAPERAVVRGERFLLRQAAANLLQNAIDFSPRGGAIAIALRREDLAVELSVEDEGPGVPGYALGRVFEKFYSLQRPDTGEKSSGLGLSFVREVALLHGGEARLENRPGGGARAVLRLPVTPPPGPGARPG